MKTTYSHFCPEIPAMVVEGQWTGPEKGGARASLAWATALCESGGKKQREREGDADGREERSWLGSTLGSSCSQGVGQPERKGTKEVIMVAGGQMRRQILQSCSHWGRGP